MHTVFSFSVIQWLFSGPLDFGGHRKKREQKKHDLNNYNSDIMTYNKSLNTSV